MTGQEGVGFAGSARKLSADWAVADGQALGVVVPDVIDGFPLLRVPDDAEDVRCHDEGDEVAAVLGAVEADADHACAQFEAELDVERGVLKLETPHFGGSVTALAGLEAAQDAVLRGPGAELPEPFGGEGLGEGFFEEDFGFGGGEVHHRGTENAEEEQWSDGEVVLGSHGLDKGMGTGEWLRVLRIIPLCLIPLSCMDGAIESREVGGKGMVSEVPLSFLARGWMGLCLVKDAG